MALFHRVMVALARAESDRSLISYARLVAGMAPGAEFHFIHALDWPEGSRGLQMVDHGQAVSQIKSLVEEQFGNSGQCYVRVLPGDRTDQLLEYAAEWSVDLILMGHRRNRNGRRSMARRLAMKAPCSVWVVPEGSAVKISKVLAAVDFSKHSASAMYTAAAITRDNRLPECIAVYAHFGGDGARPPSPQDLSDFITQSNPHNVRVKPVVTAAANVSEAVHRLMSAESLDLVVLGSRGSSDSNSILLGAESEQVIMQSPIPVLVVKQPGERLEVLEVLLDRTLCLREEARPA